MFKYAKNVLTQGQEKLREWIESIKERKGKKKKVHIPWRAHITKWKGDILRQIVEWFNWIEVMTHCLFIFVLMVLYGMRVSILTAVGAVAIYFLWQELKMDLKSILSAIGKR